MGRPKAEIVLNDREREQLETWTRRRKTAQSLALRSRIVLECATGVDSKIVAHDLSVSQQTVSKWCNRFAANRLDGLLDAPRSGAPRTIDDARVDAVIAKTLETVPKNATHWSTRSMAREMGLSQTAVSRIWRAFVRWYNFEHRHSGIRYVTPAQRHALEDRAIRATRHQTYLQARERHPARWSRETRDWTPVGAVTLNPERDAVVREQVNAEGIAQLVA